jgi:hypothetical protein
MNTNPDEAKLALWLDDELVGEELASFERWACTQAEHVAARAQTRQWRDLIASNLPVSEELPFPDFFNHRVAQAIREQNPQNVVHKTSISSKAYWRRFFLPIAACAGMVLTFFMGKSSHFGSQEIDVAGAPRAIPVEQIVYSPETGVNAELFASANASATVIVLDGVKAIPDSMDFTETADISSNRDINSTAFTNLPLANSFNQ